VSYLDRGGRPPSETIARRIDYRERLSEADFAIYAKLRSLRKSIAERDGLPAYALFTNEQLAAMVQQRVTSLKGLEEIPGVGPARVSKYGAAFLEILRSMEPGKTVLADGKGQTPETSAN
jgi:superfamily II DNA helicase RecQ